MTAQPAPLHARLAQYLTTLWQTPVAIENLARIPGGASRETYRFDAITRETTRGLILRRDPISTLIETERQGEYRAYQSFHPRGIPTPEPIHLDEQGGLLERPFFIMSRIDGGTAANPFAPNPYAPHEHEIGRQFFELLGQIAKTPVEDLPFTQDLPIPTPETCWQSQLAHWENTIDTDELRPQPIARAAIRKLRRAPPPPAQKIAVIHGDYRSGNFLHDGNGRILAILDWEMAHLGDPLEDLGWALDPLWAHGDPSRPAGTILQETAIEIWEKSSGLTVNPEAFAWWQLFNAVKGLAIWISAAHAYRKGGGTDPVLGFSGWFCGRQHDAIVARMLEQAYAKVLT
jgi:aminoglycoside phosphotransferase (APT) family kinase protein